MKHHFIQPQGWNQIWLEKAQVWLTVQKNRFLRCCTPETCWESVLWGVRGMVLRRQHDKNSLKSCLNVCQEKLQWPACPAEWHCRHSPLPEHVHRPCRSWEEKSLPLSVLPAPSTDKLDIDPAGKGEIVTGSISMTDAIKGGFGCEKQYIDQGHVNLDNSTALGSPSAIVTWKLVFRYLKNLQTSYVQDQIHNLSSQIQSPSSIITPIPFFEARNM